MSDKIDAFLGECIRNETFTGAAYAYGSMQKLSMGTAGTIGTAALSETDHNEIKNHTLFDLASCSKIVTGLVFMRLLEEGRVTLTDTVAYYLSDFAGTQSGGITMFELLTHTGRLPSHIPLYELCSEQSEARKQLAGTLLRQNNGVEYSCMGFILLGWVLEEITQMRLDKAVHYYVQKPLNMTHTMYCPLEKGEKDIAATEYCLWRKRRLQGEVHDENAYFLGGVSGNAGLFSDIEDVCSLAKAVVSGNCPDGSPFLSRLTIECMTKNYTKTPGLNRGLVWVIKNTADYICGEYFSDNSFGHTGFTGTSLFIDPMKGIFAVLLTNRVYYTRELVKIRRARQIFHNLLMLEEARLQQREDGI